MRERVRPSRHLRAGRSRGARDGGTRRDAFQRAGRLDRVGVLGGILHGMSDSTGSRLPSSTAIATGNYPRAAPSPRCRPPVPLDRPGLLGPLHRQGRGGGITPRPSARFLSAIARSRARARGPNCSSRPNAPVPGTPRRRRSRDWPRAAHPPHETAAAPLNRPHMLRRRRSAPRGRRRSVPP